MNTSTSPVTDSAATTPAPANNSNRQYLRRELWWTLASIGFGFIVLPGLIYAVGTSLLGPYGGANGVTAYVGSFYGDVYRALATPTLPAWSIVLGPMVVVMLLRLLLVRWPTTPSETTSAKTADVASVAAAAEPAAKSGRREPFVGS